LKSARDAFDAAIPDLKGIRDSLAHLDERLRKQAYLHRETYTIDADRWEISCLANREFRMTMVAGLSDRATHRVPGRVGALSVTFGTVEAARVALQSAINAFQWDGPSRWEPR
jgi:hypothetical protein